MCHIHIYMCIYICIHVSSLSLFTYIFRKSALEWIWGEEEDGWFGRECFETPWVKEESGEIKENPANRHVINVKLGLFCHWETMMRGMKQSLLQSMRTCPWSSQYATDFWVLLTGDCISFQNNLIGGFALFSILLDT